MTSLVQPVSELEQTKLNILDSKHNTHHHRCRNILKTEENTYRPKCKKVLKRKLKKYKLRQAGKEDQDVLDVSEILLSTLIIKSPNTKPHSCKNTEGKSEDTSPKNYLFKMVRSKKSIKILENYDSSSIKVKELHNNEVGHVSNQEKKQTNAFELMMESRNKSHGSNSPGKEKPNDEFETQEIIEKKNIKAKQHLLLQKMAEAKGSIEKREIEIYQEKLIKKKMDKRAERLKSMILNKDVESIKNKRSKYSSAESPPITLEKPLKTLQLVNIPSETVAKTNNIINSEKAYTLKSIEDEDFLKKLSPSLRKKESMLCYLKKIDKVHDCSPAKSENDTCVIKVKLTSKSKKKARKSKLSLKKDSLDSCDLSIVHIEDKEVVTLEGLNVTINKGKISSRRKRKRDFKEIGSCDAVCFINDPLKSEVVRPRRSMKKPIKYSGDAYLTSSDEDLHIFTPKKKKHADNKCNPKAVAELKPNKNAEGSKKLLNAKNKSAKDITSHHKKNTLKLAPIFATKMQSNMAAIEAKQKFLKSGVPDQLKKVIAKQKNKDIVHTSFPKVVHVQQIETVETSSTNEPCLNLHKDCSDYEIHSIVPFENNLFDKLINLAASHNTVSMKLKQSKNTLILLQNIKQMLPNFPVYRTYRLLKDKKKGDFKDFNHITLDNSIEILNGATDIINENPDQLSWTDKYKGMSTNQVIGNFESLKEMRKWLVTWTESQVKSKNNTPVDSDSSDFYQSDADSGDSGKSANNLLIVTGPVGSGKTSSVYAVASDLAVKVIEVNASSKRTGKIMLQDLQEATQSHKVNRGTGSADNSQKSQEINDSSIPKKLLKRGRPKKVVEDIIQPLKKIQHSKQLSGSSDIQENSRTGMSLILIDDADIVFDQDDGFCSALVQLVHSSKRPVVMVTTSLQCPHLQRFLQCGKIIRMHPLLPRMLGTWLDIMCLADNGICWPGIGAKFLNYFKGDIRKTINCLQFYISTQEHLCSLDEEKGLQSIDYLKSNIDEETSSMSWVDREVHEDRSTIDSTIFDLYSVWNNFVNAQSHLLHFKYPLELFNIWWSIPLLLNTDSYMKVELNEKTENKSKNITELEALCKAIDTLSVSDYFRHTKPEQKINITSKPWYKPENHSVSEQEDVDHFVKNYVISDEISHELIKSSIVIAQKTLGCDSTTDIHFPDMTVQRERDRVISRHKNLTAYLSQSAVLDRRALALDYWSSCRTICRIEKAKTGSNSRRNSRFCHYLKSLSVLCGRDLFDNLGNSLSFSGNS